MELTLINGQFNSAETIDIISKMVNVKIKFHEDKIQLSSNQEDIKMREKRIKNLQHEFHELKKSIIEHGNNAFLKALIQINFSNLN